MTKKTSKLFSVFWIAAGIAWMLAAIRNIMIKDDVIGTVIYVVAAFVSFVLVFAYYKNFVK